MNRPPHVRPITPAAHYQWAEDHPDKRMTSALELVLVSLAFLAAFVFALVLVPIMAAPR